MSDFARTNINGLVKDRRTSFIVNTNTAEFNSTKAARQQFKEVNSLRAEMADIRKQLDALKQLVEKLTHGSITNTD